MNPQLNTKVISALKSHLLPKEYVGLNLPMGRTLCLAEGRKKTSIILNSFTVS